MPELRSFKTTMGPKAWLPTEQRTRYVSRALQSYAALTMSTAHGAFRDPNLVLRRHLEAAE